LLHFFNVAMIHSLKSMWLLELLIFVGLGLFPVLGAS